MNKKKPILLILVIILVFSFLLALKFGAADIPYSDLIMFIFGRGENANTLILKEIRFPRIVAAAIVGMALAVAGAFMQGMTQNPLASPSLFGLSGGASAALSLSLVIFKNINVYGALLACLIGSVLSALLVFVISLSGKHGLSNNKTILAGTAVSTLLYAVSDSIALHSTTTKQMTLWASNGLIGVTFKEIFIIFPIVFICLIFAVLFSGKLTVLSLGEELATGLGENVLSLKILFFFLVTFLTGAAIALAGSIVFAGLVIPHLVRKIIGSDYKNIVPFSLIVGAIFLILTDLVARIINLPYETPISSIMAVSSYPVFLYIVKKRGASFAQ